MQVHDTDSPGAASSSTRDSWLSIAGVGGAAPNLTELASRLAVDPEFLADARRDA